MGISSHRGREYHERIAIRLNPAFYDQVFHVGRLPGLSAGDQKQKKEQEEALHGLETVEYAHGRED